MSKIIELKKIEDLLFDGMSICVGGFMANGTSEIIIDTIVSSGVANLTIICNDAGYVDRGVGKLISNGQVTKLVTSHIGLNPLAGELMTKNLLEVELVPQGTLAERVRAGGNGIGGFYTPVGIGTDVEKGKEIKTIDDVKYILEKPIKADLGVLRVNEIDRSGNATYSKTARNFNPLMAMCCEKVVASARYLLDDGEIDPSNVVTPHIFIDYIVEEIHGN